MKLSLNLLNQFFEKKLDGTIISQALNENGLEVEEVVELQHRFSNVVTAEIVKIERHENADRLLVVECKVGNKTVAPVVCGAKNFVVGDKVALALPGAQIAQNIHSEQHEPFVLEKTKIRGVESQGMLCAAFELGLEDLPGEGIMILDKNTKTGDKLEDIFPVDVRIDVSIPANRPDLHSHYGVARELSAILSLELTDLENNFSKLPLKITENPEISPTTAVLSFYNLKIEGISVQESNAFTKSILRTLQIKPVNNLVDATNLISAMIGQPLHAFDADKIAGRIKIRKARQGEQIVAINHKTYILSQDDLVLADNEKPLDIAGVMGGADTEISEHTKNIYLTSCRFDPISIRRTSKRLQIKTDASTIFEKGISPKVTKMGFIACAQEILKISGGICSELEAAEATGKVKEKKVSFKVGQVNSIIGAEYSESQVKQFLEPYGIKVGGSKTLTAISPWWRSDINTSADIAEEVLKVAGYNSVKPEALSVPLRPELEDRFPSFVRNTKTWWAKAGYFEVQTYSFVSAMDLEILGKEVGKQPIEIKNPQNNELRFMRKGLLPSVLKIAGKNAKLANPIKIFEFGKIYKDFENENWELAILQINKKIPAQKIILEMKAELFAFLSSIGINGYSLNQISEIQADCEKNGTTFGNLQVVPKSITQKYSLDSEAVFLKLSSDYLFKNKKPVVFSPYSIFPTTTRDISIIAKKSVTWQQIEKIIKDGSNLITSVEMFEAWYKPGNEASQKYHEKLDSEGKRNYGFRLGFNGLNKTLTEQEIAGIIDKIVVKLNKDLGIEI